jgi:hypothetical protein
MTFTDFNAALGCPLTNARWAWSALSPDGRRATFTIWTDQVSGKPPHQTYVLWSPTDTFNDRLGAREIREHAARCAADPGIEALGILCDVEDPEARVRSRAGFRKEYLLVLRIEADADDALVAHILAKKPYTAIKPL